MMNMINNQMNKWESDASGAGIEVLFKDFGPWSAPIGPEYNSCAACHWKNAGNAAAEGGANRFNTCSNCHGISSLRSGTPLMTPPQWLNFTSKAVLMSQSYYLPGKTKAEASLARARDGSMPPGAAYHSFDIPVAGTQVGWCDEIQAKVQAWIDAGYP